MGLHFIYFVLIFFTTTTQILATYDVCAPMKYYEACQHLSRDEEFNCHRYYNQLDCAMNIDNGTTTFGRVTADEALLIRHFEFDINIVGKIFPEGEYREDDLLVLTKFTVENFKDLEGKKLCHPGHGKLKFPRSFTEKFENTLLDSIDKNRCDDDDIDTDISKHYKALSKFFGDSCKPGPWVDYNKIDKELKQNYTSLCAGCDGVNGDKCGIPNDPLESALSCFRKNGDVVVTTYNAYYKNRNNLGTFYFLCENGSTLPPKNDDPRCNWGQRPSTLLIQNKTVGVDLKLRLEDIFRDRIVAPRAKKQSEGRANIESGRYLEEILFKDTEKLEFLEETKNIKELLDPMAGEIKPNTCDKVIKWCVGTQLELGKCLWFSRASKNQGITPSVKCVLAKDQLDCIYEIADNKADIVNIDNSFGYVARKKGLTAIAYPETYKADITKSMIVVKNTTGIKNFADLKGKFGCFSEFGDIAFMSAFKEFQRSKTIDIRCDYGLMVSNFVGDSCVPGARDEHHGITKETESNKLCNCAGDNTASECSADSRNKYFGNPGALKCLQELGDFAVITNKNLTDLNLYQNFTLICKNNTLAQYPGLKVDDNCFLSLTTNTELVIRRNDPNERNMLVALSGFEKQFGRDQEKAFELFNIFNGTLDLIFKDSTPGLSFPGEENQYIKNYLDVFDIYDQCAEKGKSTAASITFNLILILFSFFIIFN